MRSLQRVQRLVALALLGWHLPSCAAGWRTQAVVPQEAKRTMYAGDVRVTATDGTTHTLRGVWVSADSLGGWLVQPAGSEVAFSLVEVRALQVRTAGSESARAGRNSLWLTGGVIGTTLGVVLGGLGTYTVCHTMDVGFKTASANRDSACWSDAGKGLMYGAVVGGLLGVAIGLGAGNSGR